MLYSVVNVIINVSCSYSIVVYMTLLFILFMLLVQLFIKVFYIYLNVVSRFLFILVFFEFINRSLSLLIYKMTTSRHRTPVI